jgi:hypothetical protein
MGREIDAYQQVIDELPYQFFIDTATWGLRYHEIKYGLTIREDLSYDERRARIKVVRDTRYSITPWKMEYLVQMAYGITIHVHDCNEPGWEDAFEHPNIFEVDVEGDGAYKVIKYIYTMNRIETNILILKQIYGPQGHIYTLNAHDCRKLHIKYQPGLQVFPMNMNWGKFKVKLYQ